MPQLFNLGGLQVQSLNELRINKLMSEDAANTFFEYDSANTKFEMNLDQITNNHLPVYACRAWVNFDGTFGTSPFTIANGGIRASENVSSVTDNSQGNYTVNFTTAMPDSNYSLPNTLSYSAAYPSTFRQIVSQSTTSFRIIVGGSGGTLDMPHVHISIFR